MTSQTETRALWISIGATGTLVAMAFGVYSWLAIAKWDKAANFGALGDAIAPFAGLATALALGAAIYATMLQRQELKLQREEMRAQRTEMALQRAESEKAASAQIRLAEALEKLAKAQEDANQLTEVQELTLRRTAIASLTVQIPHIEQMIATAGSERRDGLERMLREFEEQLVEEKARFAYIEKNHRIGENQNHD